MFYATGPLSSVNNGDRVSSSWGDVGTLFCRIICASTCGSSGLLVHSFSGIYTKNKKRFEWTGHKIYTKMFRQLSCFLSLAKRYLTHIHQQLMSYTRPFLLVNPMSLKNVCDILISYQVTCHDVHMLAWCAQRDHWCPRLHEWQLRTKWDTAHLENIQERWELWTMLAALLHQL